MLNCYHAVPAQMLYTLHALPPCSHTNHSHQRFAISIPFSLPLHLPFPSFFFSSNGEEPQVFLFFLKDVLDSVTDHLQKCQMRRGEPRGTT